MFLVLAFAVITAPAIASPAAVSQLPDLRPAPPAGVYLAYVDPVLEFGPRALRFATVIGNFGPAPFEMVAIPAADASEVDARQCVSWVGSVCLEHSWSVARLPFDPFAFGWRIPLLRHELRKVSAGGDIDWANDGLVTESSRSEVCLTDDAHIEPSEAPANGVVIRSYPVCSGLRGGISAGMYSIQSLVHPEQYLPIEDVPDGRYAVVAIFDAANVIRESDDSNNASFKMIEVLDGGTKVRVLR